MPNNKIKKRIWLSPNNLQFIKKENNLNVFELKTANPITKIIRTVVITTKHNLLEIAHSEEQKEMGFNISEDEKNNIKLEINDNVNLIKIWRRALVSKSPSKPKNKPKTPDTLVENKPHKHLIKQPHTIYIKPEPNEDIHNTELKSYFTSEISKINTKISVLENQITELLINTELLRNKDILSRASINQTETTNNLKYQPIEEWQAQIHSTLQEILNKLGHSNKVNSWNLSENSPRKKNWHKRNWKERGYVSIRTYSNPQKIELINTTELQGQTVRTYLLKTVFCKQLKEISIETQQEIVGNAQINFYIHQDLISSDIWSVSDSGNQLIVYQADKNYTYIKV